MAVQARDAIYTPFLSLTVQRLKLAKSILARRSLRLQRIDVLELGLDKSQQAPALLSREVVESNLRRRSLIHDIV
jgi:hypothetical protein